LTSTTTGDNNTAMGLQAGYSNSTGSNNTAIGLASLYSNTTGTYSTAVGYQALYTNNESFNTAVGNGAGYSNTTGGITAIGSEVLYANTTGEANVGVGGNVNSITASTLRNNTTGSYNTAVGMGALNANTTANGNTSVGYQAGYSSTGANNTFLGFASGNDITTGNNNVIIGRYNGNSGGLDIRTTSNYIVLSDGDGNPLISTNSTRSVALNGAVPQTGTGITFPATQSASSNANTLDDYEEGTFTPNQGSGLTVVGTFSSTGTYTKIGNLVNVQVSLSSSTSIAIGGGDAIMLTNLPFATANRSPGEAINIGHNAGIFTSTSSSTVYSCGSLAATTTIFLSITYRV